MNTKEVLIERRAESHRAIEQLVSHRTEMLALYGELAAHRPFSSTPELVDLLQRFCQSLIDYTADAHFRLYRFFDANQERRMSVAKLAKHVYPHIEDSTQKILDFNDRYDTPEHCDDLSQLEDELSMLGEKLADRIELEDKLVEVLCRPRD
ncbi:MAG: sigma D regulator [Gammaproteobacteria bacterium]|nr:sigma D regulator [Gammaproteobacteria bacterium]